MTSRDELADRIEAVIMDRPQSLRSEDLRPLIEAILDAVTCTFQSSSSDDGYCKCILLDHETGNHKCIHGWLR